MQHGSKGSDPTDIEDEQRSHTLPLLRKKAVYQAKRQVLHARQERLHLPSSWRIRSLEPSHDCSPSPLYARGEARLRIVERGVVLVQLVLVQLVLASRSVTLSVVATLQVCRRCSSFGFHSEHHGPALCRS